MDALNEYYYVKHIHMSLFLTNNQYCLFANKQPLVTERLPTTQMPICGWIVITPRFGDFLPDPDLLRLRWTRILLKPMAALPAINLKGSEMYQTLRRRMIAAAQRVHRHYRQFKNIFLGFHYWRFRRSTYRKGCIPLGFVARSYYHPEHNSKLIGWSYSVFYPMHHC